MNFHFALQSLRDQKRVRRDAWPNGAYMELRNGKLETYNGSNFVHSEDLLAGDWVIALSSVSFQTALEHMRNGFWARNCKWDAGFWMRCDTEFRFVINGIMQSDSEKLCLSDIEGVWVLRW